MDGGALGANYINTAPDGRSAMYTRRAFRPRCQLPLKGETTMPSYLVQTSYTTEALSALMKNPQNRTDVVRKAIEKLGGKLVGAWMSFGEQDIVLIMDMPDNVSAAAMVLATCAGGSVKGTKTTPLFSFDEGLAALKKAATSGYTPIPTK